MNSSRGRLGARERESNDVYVCRLPLRTAELGEISVGSSVEVIKGNNLIASAQEVHERSSSGRSTGKAGGWVHMRPKKEQR